MPGTRSSARLAEKGESSPPSSEKKTGIKRKAEEATSPGTKRSGRPAKEQKTLEEVVPDAKSKDGADEEMEDAEAEGNSKAAEKLQKSQENGDHKKDKPEAEDKDEDASQEDSTAQQANSATDDDQMLPGAADGNALDHVKADEVDAGKTDQAYESKDTSNGDAEATAIEDDQSREKAQPSNILEKGIIYFFTRGRVGVEDPNSVTDLQRSFFVLRPLPAGAKITDGAVQDVGNNRLIAIPKKVWPKSGQDRFMAFVEKEKSSIETLKETFFQGSDYNTKTTGTRHTPGVTPVGEGVYAMTSTGQGRTTTHLAYMLTIPQNIGEVQRDVGLAEKGSFVLSTKNPEASSPAYAQLPSTPEFPKEILEEFGGRGWLPTKPEHLDYASASFLLIGESDTDKALEGTAQDERNDDKEVPQDELIKLEDEDEERIRNLKGDNTIFADLGISSKEYPKVKSTW